MASTDITLEPVARALYCAGPCSDVTVAAWLQLRNMPLEAAAAPKRLFAMKEAGQVCTRVIGDEVPEHHVGNGVG